MKLSACVEQFLGRYLPHIQGASPRTIGSYRDTLGIFLPFLANRYDIKINALTLNDMNLEVVLEFLDHLEKHRKNCVNTRNHRLAALKSMAKMIRLLYPEYSHIFDTIRHIPQKRCQKALVGFLYPEEILKVFQSVDLKTAHGFRDYTLLHLLFDSGARASEIASLTLDAFNPSRQTLAIVGKGNRCRIIELLPKTVELMVTYVAKHRSSAKPLFDHRLFINQRSTQFTRHGIYRLCAKYLHKALDPKRLADIHPVHSFRHSRAVNMLSTGYSLTDIKNHLGHENIQSTMIYLKLDLNRKKQIQKQFIHYMNAELTQDSKIEELLEWDNRKDILAWLDSL